MEKMRLLIVGCIVVLVVISCNLFLGAPEIASKLATETKAANTTSSSESVLPTGELPCQSDKWKVVPIGTYQYPSDGGFKLVIVELAVLNQSNFWGTFGVSPNQAISITTEGGFNYPLLMQLYDIPKVPLSPYGGRQLNSSVDIRVGIPDVLTPPGFNLRGWAFYGQYRDVYPFVFAFRVASTQNHFVLNLIGSYVICYQSDGRSKLRGSLSHT